MYAAVFQFSDARGIAVWRKRPGQAMRVQNVIWHVRPNIRKESAYRAQIRYAPLLRRFTRPAQATSEKRELQPQRAPNACGRLAV